MVPFGLHVFCVSMKNSDKSCQKQTRLGWLWGDRPDLIFLHALWHHKNDKIDISYTTNVNHYVALEKPPVFLGSEKDRDMKLSHVILIDFKKADMRHTLFILHVYIFITQKASLLPYSKYMLIHMHTHN